MNVYDYADKLLDKLSDEPLTIDKITVENNQDIFENIRNLLKQHKLLPDYNNLNLSREQKSSELATKHRLKGNELFKDRKYFSALCDYNVSLCHAETNSDDLGLAFANRSAVFYEIGEFRLCKENINLAKEFGYPSNKLKKLERRERKCHSRLKGKLRELSLLQITRTTRTKYPFVTDCLRLGDNSEYGRHIVTDCDLNIGEIVAIDRPYCGLLLTEFHNKRCTNCLRQFKMNLVPCAKCTSGEEND